MLLVIAPILVVGVIVAIVCDVVQVKWKPTGKPLQPKFNKLNPISGFKRIFSANSLMELLKSIAKIGIIVYVAYSFLKDKISEIFLLYDIGLNHTKREAPGNGGRPSYDPSDILKLLIYGYFNSIRSSR